MAGLVDVRHTALLPECVKEIYFESFPAEERRDWADLTRLVDDSESPLNMSVIVPDGTIGLKDAVGFITWWRLDGFVYVEHFAIGAGTRGGGLGSEAIKMFVAEMEAPVVLEVEPRGSNDMANRRIGFYERCGFIAHYDFEYIQPPYSPHLPSVPLVLMTTNAGLSLDYVASQLHRRVYGVDK